MIKYARVCASVSLYSFFWARILRRAKGRAASGTLLKGAAGCLVESQAMSRKVAMSSGDRVAARKLPRRAWWNLDVTPRFKFKQQHTSV